MTGSELLASGRSDGVELIRGKLHSLAPLGWEQGRLACNVGSLLRAYVREKNLGEVMVGEVGIYTGRNPDTVRAADVLFISTERMATVTSPGYLDAAPELIVEILSPGDRWVDIHDKLEEYFGIGVVRVWLVDSRRRRVFVYRSPTDVRCISGEETISGEDALPGFEMPVTGFFE
jgi:Uma2 family endonuclease